MKLSLDAQIESLLFWKGKEIRISELKKVFKKTEAEIVEALRDLNIKLQNRGLILMVNNDRVSLTTHTEMGQLLESLHKEEIDKSLSKATLETLAIVMYRAPVKRSEIDYIRGVNSSTILRTLAIRGLIEKTGDPENERIWLYRPTSDLLRLLGIVSIEQLPNYETLVAEIAELLDVQDEQEESKGENNKIDTPEETTIEKKEETEHIHESE